MIRRTVFILPLLILLIGCGKKEREDAAKESEPVRTVFLDDIKRGDIEREIEADGVLRALDQATVNAKITAPVARFLVNRGDHVTAGQLVAVLESKDLAASVADAKGALDQSEATLRGASGAAVPDNIAKAEADVASFKPTMEAAQKLLDSRQKLLADGAIARRSVDEASVAYATAKAQYDAAVKHLQAVQNVSRVEDVNTARGLRDSAKGKLEAAQAQLSYAEVHSPIAGVVADRPMFAGEMASPGVALMTIMNISSVIARVNVPQGEAHWVKIGMPAKLVSGDGGPEVAGRVTVISPAQDPQGTTVEVWIQAANPGEKLRPGATVHARIIAETVKNAILVPLSALFPHSDGGTSLLTVADGGTAKEHQVKVGLRNKSVAQILEGIPLGEQIVVSGGLGLEDGAPVKIGKKEDKDDDDDQ